MAEKEKKVMTFKDLMFERGTCKTTGTIVSITGEANKTSKKGWIGSSAEVTLSVNGVKQKIKVFGGVQKDEFNINVFQLDGEGQFLKGSDGKSIKVSIPVDAFNEKTHRTFDKLEVIEWGERDAEGKAVKIEHISELTNGRFANALLENKDLLIGKRVGIEGKASFKPTQNFDKIEADLSISKITIQKTEEGKVYNDMFVIQHPLIVNKASFETMAKEEGFRGYVPMYHKYVTPIMREGKEVKGRNVYVPFGLTINKNGFLMLTEDVGYSLEDRQDLLMGKIEQKTQGAEFVIMTAIMNYKSGMIEREITIEDLVSDNVYGKYAKKVLDTPEPEKEQAIEKFKIMYKHQNPATVKGEFKQKIDFLSVYQTKDDGDIVFGISPELIEMYTLEKINTEDEQIKAKKTVPQNEPQKQQYVAPKVNTVKASEVAPPPAPPLADINNFDMDDEFPF